MVVHDGIESLETKCSAIGTFHRMNIGRHEIGDDNNPMLDMATRRTIIGWLLHTYSLPVH